MGCSSGSLQSRESTRHLPQGHFAWQGAALGAEASGRRPCGQPPESWLALSWPCMRSALLSHLQSHWHLVLFALALGKQAAEHGTPAPLSPTSGPVGQQATSAMSDFQMVRLFVIEVNPQPAQQCSPRCTAVLCQHRNSDDSVYPKVHQSSNSLPSHCLE